MTGGTPPTASAGKSRSRIGGSQEKAIFRTQELTDDARRPTRRPHRPLICPLLPVITSITGMATLPSTSDSATLHTSKLPPSSSYSPSDHLSSPSSRPTLPLLEILTFRLYAPPPPLSGSRTNCNHSTGYRHHSPMATKQSTVVILTLCRYRRLAHQIPSPLLPLPQLDDGWDQDCDPIPGLFGYSASPSASTRSLGHNLRSRTCQRSNPWWIFWARNFPIVWWTPRLGSCLKRSSWLLGRERERVWKRLGGSGDAQPRTSAQPVRSVRFRECMQLPDDGDLDPHRAERVLCIPSPSLSPNPATAHSRHKYDSLLLLLASPIQAMIPSPPLHFRTSSLQAASQLAVERPYRESQSQLDEISRGNAMRVSLVRRI